MYAGIALLSCALIGFFLLNASVAALNRAARDEQEHKLMLMAGYLNRQTELMRKMAYKLQNTYEYKPAVLRQGDHQFIALIKDFAHYNNYILSSDLYFLLYREHELVCLATSTVQIDYFMRKQLGISSDGNLKEKLLDLTSITLIVPQENPELLIFALPVFGPREPDTPNDAVLCFYMSRKFLLERLTDVMGGLDGGLTLTFGGTAVDISESEAGEHLSAQSGNVTMTLEYTGIKAYNAFSTFRRFSLFLFGAVVLVIFTVAVIAAYRSYYPIRRLVLRYEDVFPPDTQVSSELGKLDAMLNAAQKSADASGRELAHQYENLELQRDIIRRQYVKLLLNGGDIESGGNAEMGGDPIVSLSNHMPDPQYAVFVLKSSGTGSFDLDAGSGSDVHSGFDINSASDSAPSSDIQRLARMIEELSDASMRFYTSSLRLRDTLAILLIAGEPELKKAVELIEEVAETMQFNYILTIGRHTEDIREIPIIFKEALERCQRGMRQDSRQGETHPDIRCNAVQSRSADNSRQNEILKYIEEHALNYNMELSTVAEYFGIPSRQISPIIRECCGMSFKEYLTSVRLKIACNMLVSTEHTVAEISERVGFFNVSYFISVFRNLHGETPSNYRKKFTDSGLS